MAFAKAELHVHIEGTFEPELVFAIAERNDVPLPFRSVEELRRRYVFDDLQSFLDLYYSAMAVLRHERDFGELAEAYLVRAQQQGVRHAEIFFDPQAHTARGVAMETVVEGLWSCLGSSQQRYGISTALILCFLRDQPASSAMATLEAALPFRDRIIGIGLDSAEIGHPPSKFREVFARAKAEGFRCVAHAGEEGPADNIWEALDVLGVERIDHGFRCLEDPALVERLRREQVPLTVCPLSNVSLRSFERLADHNLPALIDAGLLVTINSDDPAYFGGYIGDNYDAVQKEFGFDEERMRALAANSFRAAFLPDDQRDRLIAEVSAGV